MSLESLVRKYVELEKKYGARAPETQLELDVLAVAVAKSAPGRLSFLLREARGLPVNRHQKAQ